MQQTILNTLSGVVKLLALSAVLFVIDVILINLVLPFLFGQQVIYPWVPVEYFYMYVVGAGVFHLIHRTINPTKVPAFIIGVAIVYAFNLFLLINEKEGTVEYLKTALAALVLSAVLLFVHGQLFRIPKTGDV